MPPYWLPALLPITAGPHQGMLAVDVGPEALAMVMIHDLTMAELPDFQIIMAMMGNGLSIILFLAGAFGFMYAIEKTKESSTGVFVLLAFTFFMGLMLSRLIAMVLGFSNGASLVMTAFGGTAAVWSATCSSAARPPRRRTSGSSGRARRSRSSTPTAPGTARPSSPAARPATRAGAPRWAAAHSHGSASDAQVPWTPSTNTAIASEQE